jgi:magnesium chelatase family protein
LLGLEPVPDRPQFASSLDPIRQRIHAARGRQLHRQGLFNSELGADSLPDIIAASGVSSALIKEAVARLELSVRGYYKIWRVSRTIADSADQEHPGEAAFLEALSYRSLDWEAALQG